MKLKPMEHEVLGFRTFGSDEYHEGLLATTDDYANLQIEGNEGKTRNFILPYIVKTQSKVILDVGCGVGTMVNHLLLEGYEAYGVDLVDLTRYWKRRKCSPDNFFVVNPLGFELPFIDNSVDFAFTLGVIEHVGTSNGHSDRLENYHEYRKNWLREVFRVVKPGGYLLIGGPNRNFPIDTAHGLDSRASKFEKKLSALVGASVHKTWGENFLWGYEDIAVYLEGLDYTMEPQRVKGYINYGRVPKPLRVIAKTYVDCMPDFLLGTGFNPWVMALIKKIK